MISVYAIGICRSTLLGCRIISIWRLSCFEADAQLCTKIQVLVNIEVYASEHSTSEVMITCCARCVLVGVLLVVVAVTCLFQHALGIIACCDALLVLAATIRLQAIAQFSTSVEVETLDGFEVTLITQCDRELGVLVLSLACAVGDAVRTCLVILRHPSLVHSVHWLLRTYQDSMPSTSILSSFFFSCFY